MKEEYTHMTLIQSNIVKLLWKDNMFSRGKLCKKLDRAWTTVYDNLKKLLNKNIVEQEALSTNKRGRPVELWSLTEDFVYDMESELESEEDNAQ